MKKLCLLIATLCTFNYTVKGAAANQNSYKPSANGYTDHFFAQCYSANGYEEEKTFYEHIMKSKEFFPSTITPSTPTQELVALMGKFTTLLETAPLFLTPGKTLALKAILGSHFSLILATNQIKSALLEGNRELLEILKCTEELNLGMVVPVSSSFTPPIITPIVPSPEPPVEEFEPLQDDQQEELTYFSSSSQEKSRYYARIPYQGYGITPYIRIYNARTDELLYEKKYEEEVPYGQDVRIHHFSPDEENVIINFGKNIKIINIPSGTVIQEFYPVNFRGMKVIKSPTGKYIAFTIGYGGYLCEGCSQRLIILNTTTAAIVKDVPVLHACLGQFNSDENLFLYAHVIDNDYHEQVSLISLDSDEIVHLKPHDSKITKCMFSADGNTIISTGSVVSVYDTTTKKELYFKINSSSDGVETSSDGRLISIQQSGNVVPLAGSNFINSQPEAFTTTFDKFGIVDKMNKMIFLINAPAGSESSLSPNGKLIAIMTPYNITIFDVDSKKPLYQTPLESKSSYYRKSHFSADGRTFFFQKNHSLSRLILPHNSLRQQLLLNALEDKLNTDCTAVKLTPELMECLAALPPTCRPLLRRQDACTVVLTTNTNPCLTPAPIDEVNCPICFQELATRVVDGEDVGEQVFTPCSHSYHKACITQALTTDRRCPLCRTAITDNESLTSTQLLLANFPKLETTIRTNPFITLPENAQQATTNFEKAFASLLPALKKQLRELQRELQQAVETSFAAPLALEPQATAATADAESVAPAITPTETVPAAEEEETREQRRERLAAAAVARLELQKESH